MSGQPFDRAAARAARGLEVAVGADVARLREDAGIPRVALARAAGIDASYLRRIETGTAHPSIEIIARLSIVLGAAPSLRLYPSTGPAIRDRHQAPIAEALLRTAHQRWRRFAEIAVRRPGRGWIDLGLHDPASNVFVATEINSELRRVEQLIRWSTEKATSLPSWEHWPNLGPSPTVSQLLIVRETRRTRQVATEFRRLLQSAYPADPRDALEALAGAAAWPGAAILWATRRLADGGTYRLVAHP